MEEVGAHYVGGGGAHYVRDEVHVMWGTGCPLCWERGCPLCEVLILWMEGVSIVWREGGAHYVGGVGCPLCWGGDAHYVCWGVGALCGLNRAKLRKGDTETLCRTLAGRVSSKFPQQP